MARVAFVRLLSTGVEHRLQYPARRASEEGLQYADPFILSCRNILTTRHVRLLQRSSSLWVAAISIHDESQALP